MAAVCEGARAAGVPFERDAEPRECEVHTGEVALRYLEWGDEEARRGMMHLTPLFLFSILCLRRTVSRFVTDQFVDLIHEPLGEEPQNRLIVR